MYVNFEVSIATEFWQLWFSKQATPRSLIYFLLQDYFDRKRFSFFVFIADQVHPNERVDHYVFWDGEYPKGPNDIVCRKSQQKKRNETATAYQESNFILDTGEYFWWSCVKLNIQN